MTAILTTETLGHREDREHKDPRTSRIIAAALEVHRAPGPGLLESAYEECLCHEFYLRGIEFERQLAFPITFKGLRLDCGYRIDFLVEDTVVVELKAIEKLLPVHHAQLLTYMKVARKSVGLLMNFNVPLLTRGIVRKVL
jgi:GxxExxY protein